MTAWKNVLQLNSKREIISGSETALCDAVRRGADLRIYTEFHHNEHIDVNSDNSDLIQEVSEFPITYLVDDCWTAAIMSWRQPVGLPDSFGPRPSLSFFLYNQNGQQAIARPFLDGKPVSRNLGPTPPEEVANMPKYHQQDNWDGGTNAPSANFIYDFEEFRYCVRDDWQEVLSHNPEGAVLSGSLQALTDAFAEGAEIKVSIRGLCDDLADDRDEAIDHELFVRTGAGYFYTESKLFVAATYPLIRVRPALPMLYSSSGWDFGWVIMRTDGFAVQRLCDPYSLKFKDDEKRYSARWFIR